MVIFLPELKPGTESPPFTWQQPCLLYTSSYCRKCGKPDGLFTYMQEGREDATARPSLVLSLIHISYGRLFHQHQRRLRHGAGAPERP